MLPKRLYEIFKPVEYTLFFDINRETKLIAGKTTIVGEALEKEIYLHQKNLNIFNVKADGVDVQFELLPKDEVVKITLPKAGKVKLELSYEANLIDTMMGIYPSYYQIDGQTKQIIGTQFESTAARQAFPGIDEPAAKAIFNLELKFDEHMGETVLGNMPETKVEDGVHYFAPTLKMSTYLVAFVFGDLQSKKVKTKSGIEVGVFATKAHQPKDLDFALDIAKRSIEFFEDYYQTPYPLPHAWNVALPDFSAGAMENWGLLTYREAYLVLDEDNTALDMKQLVATVIAHELAHQWFGDLVTMQWWDDLWLNESFANMMEYVAIDAIEPDWKIWELFQTSEAPAALRRDATDGVQSVHVPVEDPAEIDSIFDGAIVYAKGARMLVMVRALIGDDAMRKGLKTYFAKHAYGNATGQDLWDAFGEASGINVGEIMESWLEQPNYPVVSAAIVDGNLQLTQNKFNIGPAKKDLRLWQIPLNSNYAEIPEIMKDQTLVIEDFAGLKAKNKAPFRLNVGNNSHFIVKYDQELLNDILINLDQLDAISQLQILQDLRLLAEGRLISYAEIVPLLPKFSTSQSNIVAEVLYGLVGDLKKFVLPDTPEEARLKEFVGQLSEANVKRLTWTSKNGESPADELSRPIILNAALYAENKAVMLEAHELFENAKNNLVKLPAATRALIIRNEVKNFGTQSLFNQLIEDYRSSTDGSYKRDLTAAITKVQDPKLLDEIIGFYKDSQTIKPQDLRGWVSGTLNNDAGKQKAWEWFKSQWNWISDTLGGDMEFTTYITVIANVFKTKEDLAEFKAFFEPKINTPGLTREIQMDLNVIGSRVALIESEKDAVNKAVKAEL